MNSTTSEKDKNITAVTLVKASEDEVKHPVTLKRNITAVAIIGLGLSSQWERLHFDWMEKPC